MTWVVNEKSGKRSPLNQEPVLSGTRFVLTGAVVEEGQWKGTPFARTATGLEPGWPSHFSTCPDAHQHRRKK